MIDLYTTPTANGFKASIMLEEVGLPYRVHKVDLLKGEHLKPEYLAINPIGRIPAIVDWDTGGEPLTVCGTAAILVYLAEKTGKLMSGDLAMRASVFQWLGFIQSDIGAAYTGQFVFNVMAPETIPWAVEHYNVLCLRMLAVFEQHLGGTRFIAGGTYTIADVLGYPVAVVSMKRHPGSLDAYPNIRRWADEVGQRPAVQKGMTVGF